MSGTAGGNLGALVLRLYVARKAAKAAQLARAEARHNAGGCRRKNYAVEGPCWLGTSGNWCRPCSEVQPHYEAYHTAANAAGAALRAVLREGKRMADTRED